MRRLTTGLLLALALCAGCHARTAPAPSPTTVSTSDLDGIDNTLSSIESDVDDNG